MNTPVAPTVLIFTTTIRVNIVSSGASWPETLPGDVPVPGKERCRCSGLRDGWWLWGVCLCPRRTGERGLVLLVCTSLLSVASSSLRLVMACRRLSTSLCRLRPSSFKDRMLSWYGRHANLMAVAIPTHSASTWAESMSLAWRMGSGTGSLVDPSITGASAGLSSFGCSMEGATAEPCTLGSNRDIWGMGPRSSSSGLSSTSPISGSSMTASGTGPRSSTALCSSWLSSAPSSISGSSRAASGTGPDHRPPPAPRAPLPLPLDRPPGRSRAWDPDHRPPPALLSLALAPPVVVGWSGIVGSKLSR